MHSAYCFQQNVYMLNKRGTIKHNYKLTLNRRIYPCTNLQTVADIIPMKEGQFLQNAPKQPHYTIILQSATIILAYFLTRLFTHTLSQWWTRITSQPCMVTMGARWDLLSGASSSFPTTSTPPPPQPLSAARFPLYCPFPLSRRSITLGGSMCTSSSEHGK